MNKKAKILFVETSRSGVPGGSFHSALLLVKGLMARKEYEVVFLFYENHSMVEAFKASGAEVLPVAYQSSSRDRKKKSQARNNVSEKRVFIRNLLRKFPHYLNIKRFILFDLPQIVKLTSIIKGNNIDILHMNDGITPNRDGIIAAKLCGIPCVVHERKIRGYDRFDLFLAGYVHKIIAISDTVYHHCRGHSLPDRRLERIYNPAMEKVIDPKKVEKIKQANAHQPILSFVGNIIEWKGQLTLLKAIRLLRQNADIKNFKVLLIGGVVDHPYHDRLKCFIEQNSLDKHVVFIDFVEDIQNYMHASDIVIHASNNPEPFGRVVLEAMSMGRIVIASREGGPKELIQDGKNGLLFDPRSAEELSWKISTVLKGDFKIDKKKVSADMLNKFSVPTHATKVSKIYDSLLNLEIE